MSETPRSPEKNLPSLDTPQPILEALKEMTDDQRAVMAPVFSGSPSGSGVPGRDDVKDLDDLSAWQGLVIQPGQALPKLPDHVSDAPRVTTEPKMLAPESETRHYTGSPSGETKHWGTGSGRLNQI